jgi:hypothetical protein
MAETVILYVEVELQLRLLILAHLTVELEVGATHNAQAEVSNTHIV